MESLLLVEDDDGIAVPLGRTLSREGYEVQRVATGQAGVDALRRSPPDLVILDLGLPDMDGLEVCRTMRASGADAAILMLTARGGELDLVVGLDAGADDYLAKPFGLAELLARVRALLRRRGAPAPDDAAADGSGPSEAVRPVVRLRVDDSARRAWVGQTEVHLSTKEFDVLSLLAQAPGTVISRSYFMDHVWDEHWVGSTKTLDVTIGRLRQKLEQAGSTSTVVAIRGVGFRLDHPDG